MLGTCHSLEVMLGFRAMRMRKTGPGLQGTRSVTGDSILFVLAQQMAVPMQEASPFHVAVLMSPYCNSQREKQAWRSRACSDCLAPEWHVPLLSHPLDKDRSQVLSWSKNSWDLWSHWVPWKKRRGFGRHLAIPATPLTMLVTNWVIISCLHEFLLSV